MHLHLRALAVQLHLKLLAEMGVWFILTVVALTIFVRGSKRVRITVVAILTLLTASYEVWKHIIPPFEQGIHESVAHAGTDAARSDLPHIGACQVFPADNIWNTPIENLPKDRRAQDYIDSIGPMHPVHPDFGSNLEYGMPYTLIRREPSA